MFQLVMITLGFMLPYRLAFQKAPTSAFDIILDLCLDLTVWVDMYLQMKMYIHDPLNGTLITDPKVIKSHYFKSCASDDAVGGNGLSPGSRWITSRDTHTQFVDSQHPFAGVEWSWHLEDGKEGEVVRGPGGRGQAILSNCPSVRQREPADRHQ